MLNKQDDLIKALTKLLKNNREFEFDFKDDVLQIHTFDKEPKTYSLKLLNIQNDCEFSGLTAADYRKIIWDICEKYEECEGCPHAESSFCQEHSTYCASYYTLKAWAEEMQRVESLLPNMDVTGDLRKQLINAGIPAGCNVIIGGNNGK